MARNGTCRLTLKVFIMTNTCVFVLDKLCNKLMPTMRFSKVRHWLKNKQAKIVTYKPFTIQLLFDTTSFIQPIEFSQDTGYLNVGNSIKSENHEYVSKQVIMLRDEKQRHDDCRMYRRIRRNRLRYRKPRFNNRHKKEGWIAPSLQHKKELHLAEIMRYYRVCPITNIYLEVGQFDTAKLKAIQTDRDLPEGDGYQKGDRYNIATLREAVFQRDKYQCVFCKRGIKENSILHVHHALYWQGRHGNQLDELVTCCEKCHTQKNHQKTGKLWGYIPRKVARLEQSAFMNTVRWQLYNEAKGMFPECKVHLTYGVNTKLKRQELGLTKSHCNDAYSMGNFTPENRCKQIVVSKKRRNNRILSKFYDAKYIDLRDGSIKTGKELNRGRTDRNHKKDSENLRKYRKQRISKGRFSVRKNCYSIKPDDIVLYKNNPYVVRGLMNYGNYISVIGINSINTKKVSLLKYSRDYTVF